MLILEAIDVFGYANLSDRLVIWGVIRFNINDRSAVKYVQSA